MPYEKLSAQMENLTNPQRSDAFYKQFRDAVRAGEVEAADLPERFELPKEYRRRGADETYTRTVKEMVVNVTPAYKKWFDGVNETLSTPTRRAAAPKVSLEAVEAGEVDFAAMMEETRRKLQASFEKGQTLGNSRKGAKPAPKARRTTKK
ncbi:hypothetical protein [Deinococcus sp. Leaf326]|uniref:hypothetical protein n=1 Tax=Deinococcus sp. Leaf326 TaxID=1736338 RepID=UPI0006F6D047|nr:hypothetical protein [Deinococcus sp. Leaf326]KQR15478.1 hypothetical protein ASF71_20420 [Deinococcus sp. Leaf326]